MKKMTLVLLLALLQTTASFAVDENGSSGQIGTYDPNVPPKFGPRPGEGKGSNSSESNTKGGASTTATPKIEVMSSTCPIQSTQVSSAGSAGNEFNVNSIMGLPSVYGREVLSEEKKVQSHCAYVAQITPPKGHQVVISGAKLRGRAQVGLNDLLQVSLVVRSDKELLAGEARYGAQGKKNYEVTTIGNPSTGSCDQALTVDVLAAYELQVGDNSFAEIEGSPRSELNISVLPCEKAPVNAVGTVLGAITSVTREGDELVIKGWSCVVGFPAQNSVSLRTGEGQQQSVIYKGRTNLPSTEAIKKQCQDTRDITHDFDIRYPFNSAGINGKPSANELRGRTVKFYGSKPGNPTVDVELGSFFIKQDL